MLHFKKAVTSKMKSFSNNNRLSHKLLQVSNKNDGCNCSLVMKLSATNKNALFLSWLRNVKACHTVCDGSYHLECEQ